MANATPQRSDGNSAEQEQYTHGYGVAPSFYAERSVSVAAFLLPYVKSGIRLLDAGCGPGSITIGLAEVVSPGEVEGIDQAESQVDLARAAAVERGVSNARFQVGDVYQIPFPDSSFHAVFSHAVLEHLSDPSKALVEMRRVLKPGGVIGIRDADFDGYVLWPDNDVLRGFETLRRRLWQHNGGDPFIGKRLRHLLNQAGFASVKGSASFESFGTFESTQHIARVVQTYIREDVGPRFVELGWANQADLDSVIASWEEWADRPDAFFGHTWCEVVGWKE